MDDERQLKAYALLEYHEAKQQFAMLKQQLHDIGHFLVTVGAQLKEDPHMYLYKQFTYASQPEIDALAKKYDQATEQVRQTREKAISFGLSVLG